jgi:hypothetical protein
LKACIDSVAKTANTATMMAAALVTTLAAARMPANSARAVTSSSAVHTATELTIRTFHRAPRAPASLAGFRDRIDDRHGTARQSRATGRSPPV